MTETDRKSQEEFKRIYEKERLSYRHRMGDSERQKAIMLRQRVTDEEYE